MLNKDQILELRQNLQKVLDASANALGFQGKIGNGKYADTVYFKITFTPIDLLGEPVVNQEEENFKRYATRFGLKPEMLGMEFTSFHRDRMKIVGLVPNRHKYPIVCLRLKDGKRFKWPVKDILFRFEDEGVVK